MTTTGLPPHRERQVFPVLHSGTRMWLAECECRYITKRHGSEAGARAGLDDHIVYLTQHGLNMPERIRPA
jgi:hypothetical protein